MSTRLDRPDLQNLLFRMGQTGQPPERGALRVNVGTDDLLGVLREEYLEPIRSAGLNSAFKIVQATYGGGKTQFLHCVREIAWDKGLAVALVGLSPKHCPFDDLAVVFRAIAQSVEMPPADAAATPARGLDEVLRAVVDRRVESSDNKEDVRRWLVDHVDRARVDSHAFRRAAVRYMEALLDRDRETEDVLGAFLRGEDVGLAEVKPFGVREVLEGKTALRFLLSATQLLRTVDLPGLVVLFDEVDRVMSLSGRRRMALADNLRELIDSTGQSRLPGLLWVYAVPPEFLTNVVPEYPALEQRLRGATRFSSINPLAPVLDLDRLGDDPAGFLERIGTRLFELHDEAFEKALDRGVQEENIRALARRLAATQLESGTRRSFVKAVVQMLAGQRLGEEKRLTDREIAELTGVGGATAAFGATSGGARRASDDDSDDGPRLEDEDVF